jgi:hypothetical protein
MSAVVPPWEVPHFGHAHLESVAREVGVDLLHVKGPALDVRLLGARRSSTDADVLVRPSQVRALTSALRSHGWRAQDSFATSSAFGHSRTFVHGTWGAADVHRLYPGVHLDPAEAFDLLWAERGRLVIAGIACTVPSVPAQLLVLLLHGARNRGGRGTTDITTAWERADEALREEVRWLSTRLRAEVGLAVALGEDLGPFEGRRELALWRSIDRPTTRTQEWRARIAAQPTVRARAATAARVVAPNRAALHHRLGRPPTRSELLGEPFRRVGRGIREVGRRRGRPG